MFFIKDTKNKLLTIICMVLLLLIKSEAKAEELWLWPLSSDKGITSYYGERDIPVAGASSNHKGIDISAIEGTPILATKSGDIFPMGYDNRMGNWTVIDHQDGTYSTYQHMQSHKIINEGFVNKGDIIGYVGSTGNSTGAHLHFEIRIGEAGSAKDFYLMLAVNPLSYEYTNTPSNINIEKEAPIQSANNGNSMSNNLFPYPERIIYRNIPMMQGNDIKWVQTALCNLGYIVVVDGFFGNDSKSKLIQFQADNDLVANGVCDESTLEKLNELTNINEEPVPQESSDVITETIVYSKPIAVKWKSINVEKSSVKLIWKKVAGGDGYEVYMSEAKGGKYKKVKTIKNGATLSYSKNDLEENKEYYFKVRAYYHIDDTKVNGAWSKVKKVGIR